MLKNNELRIGNWVMYSHKYESPLPVAIKIDISDLILIGENLKDYKYEPIVLSPEILEKCGFRKFSHEPGYTLGGDDKKSERCDEYSIGKLSIMDWGNGFILSNSFSFELRIELKSLHQLQNLYYALTGEELNYTP